MATTYYLAKRALLLRPFSLTAIQCANASKLVTTITECKPVEDVIQFRPTTNETSLKFIARTKDKDGLITIEGRPAEVPQKPVVDMKKGACPLCSLDLEVKYTDVLILKQFIRKDGVLLDRIHTGLCAKQQRHMDMLVHKAHNAGLLDCLQPPLPDGRVRKPKKQSKYKFKGLNRYFTEDY